MNIKYLKKAETIYIKLQLDSIFHILKIRLTLLWALLDWIVKHFHAVIHIKKIQLK